MVPSNFPPPPGSARIRPDPPGNPPTGAEKNIRPARRSGIEETRGMGCWMLRLFNMKTPHLGMPKKPGNFYCLFEIEMYISTRTHPKILSSKKNCYGDNWNGDFRYQPRAILLFVSMLMSSNSHRHPQTQTHIGAEFQTKKIFRAKKVLQSKPNPRPQQRLDSRVVQLGKKKHPRLRHTLAHSGQKRAVGWRPGAARMHDAGPPVAGSEPLPGSYLQQKTKNWDQNGSKIVEYFLETPTYPTFSAQKHTYR